MLKDNQNSKKSILITGASQGIGKTCAIKFLKEGYKVAVLAWNKSKLESTFNNFESTIILPCDVSNYDQVHQSFEVIKNIIDTFEEGIFTKNIIKINIKSFEEVPIHHTKIKHKTEIMWLVENYSGLREQGKQLDY